jgi:hypothetical protein
MTIYILGTLQETAIALDDKSLDQMIKDIAQVLCNVHYLECIYTPLNNDQKLSELTKNIPLQLQNNEKGLTASYDSWTQWARECVANYSLLVELALAGSDEWTWRRSDPKLDPQFHKCHSVIEWLEDNIPDLPDSPFLDLITSLPRIMPNKYEINIINFFANYKIYYAHTLPKDVTWTRREKPKWLGG